MKTKSRRGEAVVEKKGPKNHGLETECPEKRPGENAPGPEIDDSGGDSLAEALEAEEGEIELEPLQSTND